MLDRLTITISGPVGSDRARFGEHLINALGDQQGSAPGVDRLCPQRNETWQRDLAIRNFRQNDQQGRESYLGRFVGSDVWLRTETIAKKGDPVEPPFGAAAPDLITFDPFTGKDGDLVRVTFTATINEKHQVSGTSTLGGLGLNNLKTKFPDLTVERLGRPLRVGDDVIGPYASEPGKIKHIAQGIAAVEFPNDFRTIALDDLVRA